MSGTTNFTAPGQDYNTLMLQAMINAQQQQQQQQQNAQAAQQAANPAQQQQAMDPAAAAAAAMQQQAFMAAMAQYGAANPSFMNMNAAMMNNAGQQQQTQQIIMTQQQQETAAPPQANNTATPTDQQQQQQQDGTMNQYAAATMEQQQQGATMNQFVQQQPQAQDQQQGAINNMTNQFTAQQPQTQDQQQQQSNIMNQNQFAQQPQAQDQQQQGATNIANQFTTQQPQTQDQQQGVTNNNMTNQFAQPQQQQQSNIMNQYAAAAASQFPYYGAMMGGAAQMGAYGGMFGMMGMPGMMPTDQQQQQVDPNATAAIGMDPNNMLALAQQQLIASQQVQAANAAGMQQAAAMNPWLAAAYGQQAAMDQNASARHSTFGVTSLGPNAGVQGLSSGTDSMVPAVKLKQHPKKKPKGKPKRPLSAYNVFFKEERKRLLSEIPREEGNEYADEQIEGEKAAGDDGKNKKKRKHPPHGKIGFENLARTIGKRWKALSEEDIVYYKQKAEVDMKRYKKEMDKFMTKQRAASEAKLDSIFASQREAEGDTPEVKEEGEAEAAVAKEEDGEAEAAVKEEESEQQEVGI